MQSRNSKLWFKRRRYGYGWIPVTREGWLVIILFLITLPAAGYFLLKDVPDNTYNANLGMFFGILLMSVSLLVYAGYKKGPKPKWRWGTRPDDDPDKDF